MHDEKMEESGEGIETKAYENVDKWFWVEILQMHNLQIPMQDIIRITVNMHGYETSIGILKYVYI